MKQEKFEPKVKNVETKPQKDCDFDQNDQGNKGPKYDPYEIDKLSKIKPQYKIAFLKFWAAGAVYFFIAIPLGPYLSDVLDLIVALGIVIGIAIEYVINNVIRWMNNDNQKTIKYCLFEKRSLLSLFFNVAYGIVMVFIIYYTYVGFGLLIDAFELDFFTDFDFGGEPVLFGLLFLLYDGILVFLKNKIKGKIKVR